LKIIVTGSTGFVGSHIVDRLEKQFSPSDIVLLVRNTEKVKDRAKKGLNIVKGDLTKPESLSSILDYNPGIFIHAAALTNDWASFTTLMNVNAQGTRNLINLMIQLEHRPFLVHISSSGVYRRQEAVYLTEYSPIYPHGNYQRSKLEAEKILQELMIKNLIDATILRPPNIMGVRDFTHMAKICKAVKERKFPIIRNGRARQTWVAAEDLADAVLLCFQNQKKTLGQIYNLKSFEISVRELYDRIASLLDITEPPKTYPYKLAYFVGYVGEILGKIKRKPSTLNRYRVLKFSTDRLYNDDKIRIELGFIPKRTAEETITKTVKWLLEEDLV
jgi:nucleoside-diphosphate-sugar epimerase